jgi:hypothetical protein
VTDPRGKFKRVEFNTDGHLTKVTAALGQPEEQATMSVKLRRISCSRLPTRWKSAGRQTKNRLHIRPKGNVLTRPAWRRPAKLRDGDYTYEPTFNQVATITDPLERITRPRFSTITWAI